MTKANTKNEKDLSSNAEANSQTPEMHDIHVGESIVTDEHAGKGGSFIFDPATGRRKLTD